MRFVLSVALLAACADTTEAWPPRAEESVLLEADPAVQNLLPPPGVPLELEATDLLLGEQATLTATNADPGETVYFVRSTGGLGNPGVCPGPLGGNCLDVNGPVVLAGNATADAQGVASISFTVPAGVPTGLTAWFEAAALRGVDSVTSNPVERVLGQVTPWSHTIAVDGDGADWFADDEAFATTSGADTATFVTWDATKVYLGFVHPDVATGGPEHWTIVYFDDGTGSGTTMGVTQGSQTPDLAIRASHAIRRKADGSYDGLLRWDGANWVETAFWLGTQGSEVAEGGELLEIAIPRQLFGSDQIQMVSAFVFEGAGFESTFAGTPDTVFTDGDYNPDYGDAFAFDLSASEGPTAQNP